MTTYIVLDIETDICPDFEKYIETKTYTSKLSAAVESNIPSSYTGKRRAEWVPAQAQKIEQDIMKQKNDDTEFAALHWTKGKIVSIAATDLLKRKRIESWCGDNEPRIISDFFTWLRSKEDYVLTGANTEEFDKPFLIGRAMKWNLGLVPALRYGLPSYITDIFKIFGWKLKGGQRAPLNEIALGLGIKPKTMSGGDVAGLMTRIKLGETALWEKLRDYNVSDVDITAEILERFLKDFIPKDQQNIGTVE